MTGNDADRCANLGLRIWPHWRAPGMGVSNMAGGFQVEESAIETAIGHLTTLLNEARTNDLQVQQLGYARQPGNAPETASFHKRLVSSTSSLTQKHAEFITMVQNQISQLQTQLKQYQAGESSAQAGFTNKEA